MAIESPADTDAKMDMRALWLALRRRLLRIVLVTVLLLAAVYAALLFVPKTYDATASILVESRDNSYTRPTGDAANAPTTANPQNLDALISSQVELVKSRDTLLTVVRTQNLAQIPEFNGTERSPFNFITKYFKKPSVASVEDAAVNTLSDNLTVTRDRDSSIISVTVHSRDPDLAATLANAVARADVNRRAGLSLADTADASQWLDQQITQLRQRVADAETKVANFKVANDLYTGTNSTSLLDQQMTEISTQITAAQERKNTAQSRAALIRGLLTHGQPIDGVEDVRNSVTIQQLEQQKAQLTAQRAQLLATLLPSHPTVEAATAQIASVDRQIGVEGRRVADALDAEAKIEDTLQASLQSNLDAIKTKEANASRQTVTLDALNREATADRDLLESYLTRYRDAASRTDTNADLPDVRVVTLASPSNTPSSPKTTLILAAVAFVSLAVQIGATLFGELLSGRALVEPELDEPALPVLARSSGRVVTPVAEEPESDSGRPDDEDDEIEAAAEEISASVELPEDEGFAERRPARLGLRSWFSRHARSVGTTLTTFEPPMSADTPANPETTEVQTLEQPAGTLADVAFAMSQASAFETDAPVSHPLATAMEEDPDNAERLADLSADLVLGRTRIVLLAALQSHHDSDSLAHRLIADVLHRGLSVALVDAGSGRPSSEPGITDLAGERASFGDVVHKTSKEGLAEVPWGHLTTMDRRSGKPLTLVEALSDIYEVVVVMTGRVGMASSLALFAGLPCRLILVTSSAVDPAVIEAARDDVGTLGFDVVDVITVPAREAEVA